MVKKKVDAMITSFTKNPGKMVLKLIEDPEKAIQQKRSKMKSSVLTS